jgi:hypothetical protein
MDDLIDNRQMNDFTPSTLPNATAVLVLGIISIVGCLFYAIPGLVCGIISLALHKRNVAAYRANPEKYEVSFRTAKAGYICAIIGTSLSGLYIFILLVAVVIGANFRYW